MKVNRSLGSVAITVCWVLMLSGCAVGIDETSTIDADDWAAADTLSVTRDDGGTTSDVRLNDDPPDSKNPLKISGWTDGSKGSVEYNGDGTFTYTPDPNIDSGSDTFTYTAVDGKGNFSTAAVNVTIAAGWGRAVTTSTHYSDFQRLTDDNGNTTIVWTELDGTGPRYNLWAKRYSAATKTWSAAQKLDSSDADGTQGIFFRAIVDSTTDPSTTGSVTVVWTQYTDTTSTRTDLWANHFTASTGTWGTAQKIETEDLGSPSGASALVADTSGNVTVAWYQYDGTRYNVWTNRLSSTGTWGTATKLDTEDLGDAIIASDYLVVDTSGNVTAVWYQYDGVRYNLWGNRASSTGTWQTATKIENDDTGVGFLGPITLLLDSAGTVNVLFPQNDGTRYNLWANRLTTSTTVFDGTALTTAIKIESEDLGNAYTYVAVLDETSRNVTVVWTQFNGTINNMWANRYRVTASSWGTATKIETDDTGSTGSPVVKIDASANVTASWTQSDGTRENLWANRLASGMTFNGTPVAATLVETVADGNAQTPQLFVDDSGNVTAIWLQYDGTRYNAWSNRYSTTLSNWGTAAKIETDDNGTVFFTPVAVIDDSGNVTAAWYQADGMRNNVWANRMTAAGWGTATKIDTEDLGSADLPFLTVTSTGVVDLAWRQFDMENYHIWTSRYTSGAWTTPDRLTTGLSGGVVDLRQLFTTAGDVPTMVGRMSNGAASTLWVSDFR